MWIKILPQTLLYYKHKGRYDTVVNKNNVSNTRNVSFFKLCVNDANSKSGKIYIQKPELKQYPKRQQNR